MDEKYEPQTIDFVLKFVILVYWRNGRFSRVNSSRKINSNFFLWKIDEFIDEKLGIMM